MDVEREALTVLDAAYVLRAGSDERDPESS
jgi:hypothetical protein